MLAFYIGNRFHAEKITRESTRLQREVKDLRAEALSISADLMYISRQSEVYRLVKEKGLNLEELKTLLINYLLTNKYRMAVRDEIVWRSGIVYFAIALLAVAILVRILILQFVQHGKWADMSEKYVYKTAEVPANRGDILTSRRTLAGKFSSILYNLYGYHGAPECRLPHGQTG